MTSDNNDPKFVIVDDTPDILEFAKMAIHDLGGAEVTSFNSGEEFLESCEGLQKSVLLIDMMMPRLTGLETVIKLKESELGELFTPIFMTACLHDNYIQQYKTSGAIGLVQKPFDPLLLYGQVMEQISKAAGNNESGFFIVE